ncbi:MAG: T9SS type A sorting domain-containing protein [Bacteroidia bacterium]
MKKAITFLFFIHVCIAFVNAQVETSCNTDIHEPNNTMHDGAVLSAKVTYFALICDQQDVDWFIINVPSNTHNTKIIMSDCPRDYEMELYDVDGHFISGSYNKATSNEKITLFNPVAGKYYAKIYGYKKNFDNTATYALRYYNTSYPVLAVNNPVLKTQSVKEVRDITIYPNPAIDNIKINYTTESEGILKINIYDHVGRIMNSISELHGEGSNVNTLDVSYLPNGFYMVEIIVNNQRQLKKLTINQR